MVEGARLESVYAGNRIEGSNPFLSAKEKNLNTRKRVFFCENTRHKARFNVEVSEQKTSNSKAVACLSFFF